MPYEHVVDHNNRIVVVRGSGEGSLAEIADSSGRLLEDPAIGVDYRIMVVVDDIELFPSHEEMLSIVSLLKCVRSRVRGKCAIVTSRPGRFTTALLIAFAADTGSGDVQAFTSEAEARAWLLASPM
jgi:hypothetical protein